MSDSRTADRGVQSTAPKLPRPIIAGNWKMHHTEADAAAFFAEFRRTRPDRFASSVIVFPPALTFAAAREANGKDGGVWLGVQNVYEEAAGAFTGEVSAGMARAAGAAFVLVGHSERRQLFGETVEQAARKVRAVLDAGLRPVLCVGETLDRRNAGRAEAVVHEQLAPVLAQTAAENVSRLLIAYEPVWAIGTGVTASAADAAGMHQTIRELLEQRWGAAAAQSVPLLYGGSVKPQNAAELLAQPHVDGVLVGGASLKAAEFAAICAAAA